MRYRGVVALVSAVFTAVGLGACGFGGTRGSVTVLASWTGAEAAVFKQVLDRFTADTGIRVDYQGTRALSQVLLADVRKGAPPDIAVLPSLGELAGYVRGDAVHPLDDLTGDSGSPQWRQLQSVEKAGRRQRYAVAVKANLKSLIWYDPRRLPDFPAKDARTWDELVAFSKTLAKPDSAPWCLGMGSTPASGWPGTDWIEDIVLHQAGPDVYREWAAGRKDWRSPELRRAWTTWGTVAVGPGMVRGGPGAALLTDFGDAARPMFTDTPRCFLHHQASFMVSGYQGSEGSPKLGTDVDFVPFPSFGAPVDDPADRAWEVSADLAGLFVNTPEARKLIRYLATDEAQSMWTRASHGSVFSANRNVPLDVYDDEPSKRIARALTSEAVLCFDASDLMPTAMTTAFYRAVLEYLHNPGRLDTLLTELDQVKSAIPPTEWFDVPCGRGP